MGDKILIEVDCPYRNNIGACKVGAFSLNCLRCPVGYDWIKDHIKIIVEDKELSGKQLSKFIEEQRERIEKIKEDSKIEFTIILTDPEGILEDAQTDDN